MARDSQTYKKGFTGEMKSSRRFHALLRVLPLKSSTGEIKGRLSKAEFGALFHDTSNYLPSPPGHTAEEFVSLKPADHTHMLRIYWLLQKEECFPKCTTRNIRWFQKRLCLQNKSQYFKEASQKMDFYLVLKHHGWLWWTLKCRRLLCWWPKQR